MAFDRTKLSLLSTGGGGDAFMYTTTDAKATVIAANYFGPAWHDFTPGDRLFLNCNGVFTDAVVATVTAPVAPNPPSAPGGVTVLTQADYA
jgi:hypothetical protein